MIKNFSIQLGNNKNLSNYKFFGVLLLLFYIVQEYNGLSFPSLERLQSTFDYQVITGMMVLTYVLLQWRLPLARLMNVNKDTFIALRTSHKKIGSFAPVFFYIHVASTGQGYLFALSNVYLFHTLLSYADSGLVPDNYKKIYTHAWTVLHIVFSSLLLFMSLFHVYVALAYK